MKSTANRSVTFIVVLAGCLCLWAVTSAQEKDIPRNAVANHASLSAYPQAVISLKDPKTEMVFYVESNGRRLVAFDKDGAVAWSVDVLTEAKIKPARGEPVIRDLQLRADDLWVVCGRNYFAKVEPKTGKTMNMGND